ncbi:MAG: hypothetical protein HY894_08545 [Deltaproteobacteria bacterium]|nr:hypothetical protein [Deltaproteobacteria bacterium]
MNFRIDSPPAIARIDIKDNKVKCGSVRMESSLKSGIELSLWTTDAGGMNVSIEDKDAHHLNSYANRKILGVFSAAPGTIALIELDLRPLGLPIYMDKVSLKIGGATLSFNTFKKLKTGLVIER